MWMYEVGQVLLHGPTQRKFIVHSVGTYELYGDDGAVPNGGWGCHLLDEIGEVTRFIYDKDLRQNYRVL